MGHRQPGAAVLADVQTFWPLAGPLAAICFNSKQRSLTGLYPPLFDAHLHFTTKRGLEGRTGPHPPPTCWAACDQRRAAIVTHLAAQRGLVGAGGPAADARGRHCGGCRLCACTPQPRRLFQLVCRRDHHDMVQAGWPGGARRPVPGPGRIPPVRQRQRQRPRGAKSWPGRTAGPGGLAHVDDTAIDLLMATPSRARRCA